MKNLDGYWIGTIKIPNQPLPIILEGNEADVRLSIPVQGLRDYPFSKVEINGLHVFLEMNLHGDTLTFAGQIENKQITGTFTQKEQSFPFALSKGNKEYDGEPKEEHLTEIDVQDGVMRGKVEMPKGDGPFPVAIIIAGSGPTDKNGNSLAITGKNNSLKMIAEDLAEEGIASIRYDKRGIGDNRTLGENEEHLRFDDYIKDAISWISYAANHKLFSSVHVIGHSEGSLIGMAAAYQGNADAFVSLAGAGRSADELLRDQLKTQIPGALLQEMEEILASLKQGGRIKRVSSELQGIFRPSVQPYLTSWMKYEPKQKLAQLDIPVLIVHGTRDGQVPMFEAEYLHDGKPNSELLIVEDMNHVLKEVTADQEKNMAAHFHSDFPLANGLMNAIIRFLK